MMAMDRTSGRADKFFRRRGAVGFVDAFELGATLHPRKQLGGKIAMAILKERKVVIRPSHE
jgi:hypothetical protein